MPKWPLSLAIVVLPAAAAAGTFKYHDVAATFVSADTKANTFTIKFDDGSTSSGPAEGDAVKALGTLKAGDKVSVTCKDGADGKHISATAIKVVR